MTTPHALDAPPLDVCGAWLRARGVVAARSKLLLREGGRLTAEVRIRVAPDAVQARALREWGLWVVGDDDAARTTITSWMVRDEVEVEGPLTLQFELKSGGLMTSRAVCRLALARMVKRCVRG